MSPYLQDSLSKKIIFITGKGGVGKSSIAWALAGALKTLGRRIALVSTNSHPLEGPTDIPHFILESEACFREYVMLTLKWEFLYDKVFDNPILKTFLQATPGVADTVIAGKIWHMTVDPNFDTILVDLPSSGHAMSFFKSPYGVRKVFPVGLVHKEANKICDLFEAPSTRIDLVTLPEELSVKETLELKSQLLAEFSAPLGFQIINQLTPEFECQVDNLTSSLKARYLNYLNRLNSEKEVLRPLSLENAVTLYKTPFATSQEIIQQMTERFLQ
jgi:anion-transporting  ArsA/GET3 family ATPase